MRYRDHVFLSFSIYAFVIGCTAGFIPADIVRQYSRSVIPWTLDIALPLLPFLIGASFPDLDLLIWPNMARGHRMRSVLHRIDVPLCLLPISVLAACRVQSASISFAFAIFSMFVAGWLAHFCGDFIQGGLRLGFGSRMRVGIKYLNWERYSATFFGLLLSLFVKFSGAASMLWLLKAANTNKIDVGVTVAIAVSAASMRSALSFITSSATWIFIYIAAKYYINA